MIRLVKRENREQYETLRRFYEMYLDELHGIEEKVDNSDLSALFLEDTDYNLIEYNGEYVGFALIGYDSNCADNTDIYIMEFFIVPPFRKMHIGTVAANLILDKYNPKSLVLFVLKKNNIAQDFWFKLFFNDKKTFISFNDYMTEVIVRRSLCSQIK